jgi:hypothetical protein
LDPLKIPKIFFPWGLLTLLVTFYSKNNKIKILLKFTKIIIKKIQFNLRIKIYLIPKYQIEEKRRNSKSIE